MTPYVYLKLDSLRLALRQTEVRLLGTMESVDTRETRDHTIGWHPVGAGVCPVFCTNEFLQPVNSVAPQRRYCIIMAAGDEAFGLAVDEFRAQDPDSVIAFEALPACMHTATPIAEGLGVFDNDIYSLISASALLSSFYVQEVLE